MSKFLFLLILFALLQTAKSQSAESDTVWSKSIGSEVKAVKFSPDGQFIYAAALGRKPIKLSKETGEILMEYEGIQFANDARWTPLDISSDGKWLISGDYGNEMKIWDVETGVILKTLKTNNTVSQNNKFNSVSITPDNRYVLATNMYWNDSENFVQSVLIWDLNTGEIIKVLGSRFVTKVLASPDNQYFAFCYERSEGSNILPSEIILYRIGTWEFVKTFEGHQSKVADISFSPDGSLLASCGWDGYIKVWDVEQKKLVKDILFQSLNDYLLSISFSTDNKFLFVGGGNLDRWLIKVFDRTSYQEKHNYLINYLTITSEGPIDVDSKQIQENNYIITGTSRGIILLNTDWITTVASENTKSKKSYNMPNPIRNSTDIVIPILRNGNYIISIFDNNFQKLDVIHNGFLETGEHTFIWDATKYANGTYFCIVNGKDYSDTLKIMLQR